MICIRKMCFCLQIYIVLQLCYGRFATKYVNNYVRKKGIFNKSPLSVFRDDLIDWIGLNRLPPYLLKVSISQHKVGFPPGQGEKTRGVTWFVVCMSKFQFSPSVSLVDMVCIDEDVRGDNCKICSCNIVPYYCIHRVINSANRVPAVSRASPRWLLTHLLPSFYQSRYCELAYDMRF